MDNVAIFCHDAGGAEIVSNWLKYNHCEYLPVLEGPAIDIFKKNLNCTISIDFEIAIEKCDFLITGTSSSSNLEREAIKKGNLIGKKTVSILDHWSNYKNRFILSKELVLPSEIWVCDAYAQKIARNVCAF